MSSGDDCAGHPPGLARRRLVIDAAVRCAEQGAQRRPARERQLDLDRDAQRPGPDVDDRSTA